jgi:signal transduction histidine kinase
MNKVIIILFAFLVSSTYSQVSDKVSEVDSILDKAFELRWSNPYETVLGCYKALEISKKVNYQRGIIRAYSFMGVGYENLSMYEEALDNYLKGLKIADSLNFKEDVGFAYNNLANYYAQLKNFETAYSYLQKGLKVAQEINNPRLLAYIYRNFSYYNRQRKNFVDALEYAKKSLSIRESQNDERGIITSLRELMVIYFNLNDFENARKILDRLYSVIGSTGKYQLQLARIKRTEAEMLSAQKKYDEALKVFDQSLEIFKSIDNLEGIIRVLKLKAELYSSLGKYKESYVNLLEHNSYVDSLNNIRSLQRISLLEAQFKNRELQNQLSMASDELRNRNIIVVALFVGFIILGTSVYFAQKANKEKRKLIEKISEQNKILESDNIHKQKLLSIIGHDVKNPLSSVYSLSDFLANNSESIHSNELYNYLKTINKAVKNSLSLLDNLLIWSMNRIGKLNYNFSDINLSPMINKVLELYDSQIKEKNISVDVNLTNEFVHVDENTASAILRNLVNNAIKFSPPNGTIKIQSETKDGFIAVSIIDNGQGLSAHEINSILNDNDYYHSVAQKNESSTGLGLQIVKDFLKINNGKLLITSTPGLETSFTITLPKSKLS